MQISTLQLPQTGMSPKFDATLHCNILPGPVAQSVAGQIADPGVPKLKWTFIKILLETNILIWTDLLLVLIWVQTIYKQSTKNLC